MNVLEELRSCCRISEGSAAVYVFMRSFDSEAGIYVVNVCYQEEKRLVC